MYKRLWEENIQWLLVGWCLLALFLRPGWLPFGLGVAVWAILLYVTAPGKFWSLVALANIDRNKLEAHLRKAVSFQPASPNPYISLALVTAYKKNWAEAISLLETAAQKPGKRLAPKIRNVLAVCYRETGKLDQAQTIINDLLKEGYADGKVYYNLAYINYKAGRPQEALQAAEKARSFNLSDPDPVLLTAKIYFEQGDYAAAKDNYDWCIKHLSWPVESYYWLGRCELELGLITQARDHLATAVERITSDPELSDVPPEEAQKWLDEANRLLAADKSVDPENLTLEPTPETDPNQS
ncbi:MAG TPA: tetratricopeptide repeat protein [Firmicutes bacterium]|uniref:Tetratricopeptide repeat protein n=1 Tax=Capillibacterium thermochitinicola TaxID=2699427 RepID=A0A8J6I1S3_9FIRM|nr:tetratricopeptide repeat protein [Capillibacterium thermochitinicola]MBA2132809.1 tetratricopeptide repeat protein [Capillibacterium thermochitinicola]HHW12435.1 tetratricopeptide repeat protein [Bacillota bacterium]